MNYRVLFFIIGLTIMLMGSVLFFVVSSGAKHASTEVLRQQEGRELNSPEVTKGLFSLGLPAFSTEPHSCTVPFQDAAQLNVVFRYGRVPSSCDLFVNERYVGSQLDLTPDCLGPCPYGEFSRTFSVGYLDVRDSHVIRVCCNDICQEQILSAQCA